MRNVERLGVATFASPNFIDLNAIACDSLNGSDSASSDLFINGPLHQLRQILELDLFGGQTSGCTACENRGGCQD